MSLILLEGFDDGQAAYSARMSSFNGTTEAAGRHGPVARRLTNAQFSVWVAPSGMEHQTFIVGVAVYVEIGTADWDFLLLYGDGTSTTHMTLLRSATGALVAKHGGSTILGTSDASVISTGVWHYVELAVTLSNTVGAVKLRVDGAVPPGWTDLANVDTRNGGTVEALSGFRIQGASAAQFRYDDIYLCNGAGTKNNDLLGDTAVYTLLPDGNGTYSELVGSDGNSVDNYQLVDEPDEPNTADYVGSDVDGTKDTYTFGNLVPTTGTVVGVTASLYAAKTDAGTKSVRAVVRRGGVDATGADKALAMTYAPHDEVMESDPTDGTDWTIGNVNAAEFGAEVRP